MTIALEPRPSPLIPATTSANPYPVYDALRAESPVFLLTSDRDGTPFPFWGFFRYGEVYGALKDHTTFATNATLVSLLGLDPPRHTQLRAIVNRAFTPRRVAALRPQVAAIVAELLDGFGPGVVDFCADYAVPLPVRVIARLLGVPETEYPTFKRWSDMFMSFTTWSPEERARSRAEMAAYFRQIAQARRTAGAADLITALVEADVDGARLSEAETISFCVLLLIAGNETTTNLLGNLLNVLAEQPELWRRLRADRSLIGPAIEESLRRDSPVQFMARRTTRAVTVAGTVIPAESSVRVFYGAANRDPAEFPDPDRFRLDRNLHEHVAFGHGIHYCLGAPLARLEAELTLAALLDRYATVEPGGGPGERLSHTLVIYGFTQLPLRFHPA